MDTSLAINLLAGSLAVGMATWAGIAWLYKKISGTWAARITVASLIVWSGFFAIGETSVSASPEISLRINRGMVMVNGGYIAAPKGVGYWLSSSDGEYRLMIQEEPKSSSYTTFLKISQIKLISSDNGGGILLDGAHFEIADTFKMDGVRLVNVENGFSAQSSRKSN